MPRDYHKEYLRETVKCDFMRVRMDKDLKERLRQRTAADGITISQWVLNQITHYVDEPPK